MAAACIWFLIAGAAPAEAATRDLFQWRPFLAPFHSVVLHFPIGFVTMAFVLELYSLRRPSIELRRAITLVLVLSIASSVLAIGLGLMRATGGGYEEKTLNLHKAYGIAVGVLTSLALAAHWLAFRRKQHPVLTLCYRAVLVTDIVVLVIAGHQGGNLTHGSKYLVKNAPDFVKNFIEEPPEPETSTASITNEKDRFFVEKVQPIFDAKCASCHGPEKQKGDFRLDQKDAALKGGKSGHAAIKPGDPMASHLIKVILLMPDDDDVMPPSGKGTLTPEEIITLIHWVQTGANFVEKGAPATPDKTAIATTEPPVRPEAVKEEKPALEVAVAKPEPPPPPKEPSKPRPALPALSRSPDFVRDIQPILERNCVACHGGQKPRRGLRLDTLAGALKGGKGSGPALIPGHADDSPLFKRISIPEQQDPCEEHMPPQQKNLSLTPLQIAAVRAWINDGAPWPENLVLRALLVQR